MKRRATASPPPAAATAAAAAAQPSATAPAGRRRRKQQAAAAAPAAAAAAPAAAPPAAPAARPRCAWVGMYRGAACNAYVHYHDAEWGRPLRDDAKLFELLVLEGAQAGLSWATILAKRPAYREAFEGFDPAVVARYDAPRLAQLLANPGLVRHRGKLASAVQNAKAVLRLQLEHGSFSAFVWSFVPHGRPIVNAWASMAQVPTKTPESEAMSAALKQAGMSFVGPTICYAFMQAAGLVNDHTLDCAVRAEVLAGYGADA